MRVAVFSNENPETACAQLRLRAPLSSGPDAVEVVWATHRRGSGVTVDVDRIEWADLIVVQRFFPGPATADLLDRILASSKPVVYECDDLLTSIPATSPYRGESDIIRPYVQELMRRVDAVVVSTPALAAAYSDWAERVLILPNFIDRQHWLPAEPADDEPVVIGYCGTDSHAHDLELIRPALFEIARRYGERVLFKFVGYEPVWASELPGSQGHRFELDYAEFARCLPAMGLQIALAPLQDNPFNRCKSHIKWLEYAIAGAAGIYSDIEPYAASVRDGQTGLLVPDDPSAWIDALDRLVRDPNLRRTLALAAQREVLERHTLEVAGACFGHAYAEIAKARPARAAHKTISIGPDIGHLLTDRRNVTELLHLVTVFTPGDEARLADTIDSLAVQSDSNWHLTVVSDSPAPVALSGTAEAVSWLQCDGNVSSGIASAARSSAAGWIGLLEVGGTLSADAVVRCHRVLRQHHEWQLAYCDEVVDNYDASAEIGGYKPDFNLELLRSQPYMGPFCLVRRQRLVDAELACEQLELIGQELAFRLSESEGEEAVGHIPQPLIYRSPERPCPALVSSARSEAAAVLDAHLRRCGVDARIEPGLAPGSWFVDYQHVGEPMVSVIVPTKDAPHFIGPCLSSLIGKTRYGNLEVLVVDNGTTDPEALAILDQAQRSDPRVRVLTYSRPYNFSAMNNLAVRAARGEYILLLNNDTVVVQDNWLDRMMAQAQRPDVGVVGARLVYPDQRLQHAGIVLGMGANGVAEHPFMGLPMTEAGYMGLVQVAREVAAVTGACLLIRKSLCEEVGGLDENQLGVMYNDVDLCLKVRERGYRVIWTPFATLVHHGSGSLKEAYDTDPKRLEQARSEVATMLERWLPRLACDPAYNPNLSLVRNDYSPDAEMRAGWDDEPLAVPRIMAMAGGSDGSRAHRVEIPLRVLYAEQRAATFALQNPEGAIRVPSVSELAREAPDVLFVHNAVHDLHLEALERYRRFNDVFMVYGMDDLLFELPAYNEFSRTVYPDAKRRLRKAIGCCDRLVVSTAPLAEAFSSMIRDIRVVPNYLDADIWSKLHSRRGQGSKPRVGWAGAQQHSGDLEVIFDVVRETADEVQWVFFGLCFKEWLALGVEVHDPVPFLEYPAKLAALNLDLAVAPLAHNRFNQCKSNLKILEYGALGVPVVCSDIEPYRHAPVTRVPNSKQAWVNAIRERIHDRAGTVREGDDLRDWVQAHHLLQDHLEDWMGALAPGAARAGATRVCGERPW